MVGSIPEMTKVDPENLKFPYRVMHRLAKKVTSRDVKKSKHFNQQCTYSTAMS